MASVLLVTACGSGGGSSPSTAPAPHVAQPGEPALIQVAGYQYSDFSDQDMHKTVDPQVLMSQLNAAAPGVVTAASIHWVVPDRVCLLEMQLGSVYTSNEAMLASMRNGLAGGLAGSGATVTVKTISTEQVAIATTTDGGDAITAFVWIHNGVLTMVVGTNAAKEATDFVDSYLETAHE